MTAGAAAASAVAAVLFDLDGTLIDSAPDLAGAANDMRLARGLAALPYERLRPLVGTGARGMVGGAFDLRPEDDGFDRLREEFLARYEARMLRETRVFDGMPGVLDALEAAGVAWGIVTNKAMRYTEPIVRALRLSPREAAVVAGDTTPFAKPHPAPLLEAARRLAVEPSACLYVGDDLRDIVAGRAAGMRTVAVGWGYQGAGEPMAAWNADHRIDTPLDLLRLPGLA